MYNTIFTAFSQGVLVDADETATYFGDGRAILENSTIDVSSNVYSANVVTLPGNGLVISFSPVATTNATEYFRILAEQLVSAWPRGRVP